MAMTKETWDGMTHAALASALSVNIGTFALCTAFGSRKDRPC